MIIIKKILIVDDEAHIRFLLQQILEEIEEEGVEILLANNGETALSMILELKPELVFLDVMMPNKNGFEVCSIIKKDLKLEHSYIVLLTAKGQEYDKKRGIDAKADIYITKPFNPDDIIEISRRILKLEISE